MRLEWLRGVVRWIAEHTKKGSGNFHSGHQYSCSLRSLFFVPLLWLHEFLYTYIFPRLFPPSSLYTESNSLLARIALWCGFLFGLGGVIVSMRVNFFFKHRAKVTQREKFEKMRMRCLRSSWLVSIGAVALIIAAAMNFQYWWEGAGGIPRCSSAALAALLSAVSLYLSPRQLRHDLRLVDVLLSKVGSTWTLQNYYSWTDSSVFILSQVGTIPQFA